MFIHKKIPHPSMRNFAALLIVTLILVLACCLALLAALDAGALVVLLLSQISQYTGLGTAALKSFKSIVQRFVLLDIDFRHLFHSLHIRLSTL